MRRDQRRRGAKVEAAKLNPMPLALSLWLGLAGFGVALALLH